MQDSSLVGRSCLQLSNADRHLVKISGGGLSRNTGSVGASLRLILAQRLLLVSP